MATLVQNNLRRKINMSEKELLYTEDVLSHLESMKDYLENYKVGVDDANFQNVLDELENLTKTVYKKYYKLIEE